MFNKVTRDLGIPSAYRGLCSTRDPNFLELGTTEASVELGIPSM